MDDIQEIHPDYFFEVLLIIYYKLLSFLALAGSGPSRLSITDYMIYRKSIRDKDIGKEIVKKQ